MLNRIQGYRKEWLRANMVAGLTTAAVVIPKAMAYATIPGLPVQVGLYTAFLPMLIYSVMGTFTTAEREHHHDNENSGRRLVWLLNTD